MTVRSPYMACLTSALSVMLVTTCVIAEDVSQPPKVGSIAPAFKLSELSSESLGSGRQVSLKKELKKSPVVLVVLRGYPGYQCPICSRQVGALIQAKNEIAQTGATVILVYPGLSNGLETKAKNFFKKHQLPDNFTVLTDPDYRFTNLYHLRWDAPRETAYPSTFVIDQKGKVVEAKISRSHGGRSDPKSILKVLKQL